MTTPTTMLDPIRVDVQRLQVGDVLARPLFTRQGVMLLASGTPLTGSLLSTLTTLADNELYEADTEDELRRAGLLHEPTRSTPSGPSEEEKERVRALIEGLDSAREERRENVFEFQPPDLEDPYETLRERANLLKRTEEIITLRQRAWNSIRRRVTPFHPAEQMPVPETPIWTDERALDVDRSTLIEAYRPHFARLSVGLGVTFAPLLDIANDLIERYQQAPTRYARLLHTPTLDPADLPAHALLTGAACVAIGARLSWTLDDIRLACIAGLVADVGMAMVPADVRRSSHPLDEIGSNRVLRHPAHTVALLEPADLPAIITLAAYQHHERLDGTGYPSLEKDDEVCDLARVVSVADAYVASISTRPYRPARRPYDAVEEIILLAAKGRFDRTIVRALVEVTGLYPIGGFVRLSSGAVARVIGVDAARIDRPVVRLVATGEVIALNERRDISVVAPTDPPLALRTKHAA